MFYHLNTEDEDYNPSTESIEFNVQSDKYSLMTNNGQELSFYKIE